MNRKAYHQARRMTRDDVIRMAREAGAPDWWIGVGCPDSGHSQEWLERFYAAATEKERAARIAAQTENEALKERLNRADAEKCAAVLSEREACAKLCEVNHGTIWRNPDSFQIAEAIRARGAA